MLDTTKYDFLDFGSSNGGSFTLAHRLGGTAGLGIDIDPKKVAASKETGANAICADVCRENFPPKSVSFCILSHFLEHLNSTKEAALAIEKALAASRDFVFIQGPYFDADLKLKALGLKLFWSDWHGHKARITSTFLKDVFDKAKRSYTLLGYLPIRSSTHSAVHPLKSPTDSFEYDAKKHFPKPSVIFNFPVYKEIVGVVWLSNVNRTKILSVKRDAAVIIEAK